MSKERKDNSFIKKPVYPGGPSAYRKFINENLKYPEAAIKNKTEGTVFLKYSIDYKGKVTDVKVVKGVSNGCNEEAIRILKLLQFEIPKGPRKLRVLFHRKTQITFRLPKAKIKPIPTPAATPAPKSVPQKMNLVYNYQPSPKPKKSSPKKKVTYTYIIGR